MKLKSHLETLKVKHAGLEEQIKRHTKDLLSSDQILHNLKKQKLKIKESIERMGQALKSLRPPK